MAKTHRSGVAGTAARQQGWHQRRGGSMAAAYQKQRRAVRRIKAATRVA